jgi:hypothetical protein
MQRKLLIAGISSLMAVLCLIIPLAGLAQQKNMANDACMKNLPNALSELSASDTSEIVFIGSSVFDEAFARIKQIQQTIPEKVLLSDSLISFPAGQKQMRFEINGPEWYGYSGYLSDLGLHLMTHSSASAGIATSFFVNDHNGEIYYIPMQLDEGFAMVPRTNGSQTIIFYGNSVFSKESIVTVYRIFQGEKGYCLKPIASNVFPNTRNLMLADTGEGYAIVSSERQSPDDVTEPLFFEYFKLIWPASDTSPQKKQ